MKECLNYAKFMKIFSSTDMQNLYQWNSKLCSGKVWYLLHFDVYQPKKPDQIQIVFDCSDTFYEVLTGSMAW